MRLRNTPIVVDQWSVQNTPKGSVYFLTHMHTDHTKGLTSRWPHPFYCSEVTKKLALAKFKLPERNVIDLSLNEPHLINIGSSETLTVTLIDANHAPGAVMFLFQGYFGNILHTGDFRYTKEMFAHPPLSKPMPIECLYFDNTYCGPKINFPDRKAAIDMIKDCINPGKITVFGMRNLGKEAMLEEIAIFFRTWVVVSPVYLNHLKLLGMRDVFTTDHSAGWIMAESMVSLTQQRIRTLMENGAMVIIPTAHPSYTQKYKKFPNVKVIPYSDHSSAQELKEFIARVQPKSLCPIVPGQKVNLSQFNHYLDTTPHLVVRIPAGVGVQPLGVRRRPPKNRAPKATPKAPKQTPQGVIYEDNEEDQPIPAHSKDPDKSQSDSLPRSRPVVSTQASSAPVVSPVASTALTSVPISSGPLQLSICQRQIGPRKVTIISPSNSSGVVAPISIPNLEESQSDSVLRRRPVVSTQVLSVPVASPAVSTAVTSVASSSLASNAISSAPQQLSVPGVLGPVNVTIVRPPNSSGIVTLSSLPTMSTTPVCSLLRAQPTYKQLASDRSARLTYRTSTGTTQTSVITWKNQNATTDVPLPVMSYSSAPVDQSIIGNEVIPSCETVDPDTDDDTDSQVIVIEPCGSTNSDNEDSDVEVVSIKVGRACKIEPDARNDSQSVMTITAESNFENPSTSQSVITENTADNTEPARPSITEAPDSSDVIAPADSSENNLLSDLVINWDCSLINPPSSNDSVGSTSDNSINVSNGSQGGAVKTAAVKGVVRNNKKLKLSRSRANLTVNSSKKSADLDTMQNENPNCESDENPVDVLTQDEDADTTSKVIHLMPNRDDQVNDTDVQSRSQTSSNHETTDMTRTNKQDENLADCRMQDEETDTAVSQLDCPRPHQNHMDEEIAECVALNKKKDLSCASQSNGQNEILPEVDKSGSEKMALSTNVHSEELLSLSQKNSCQAKLSVNSNAHPAKKLVGVIIPIVKKKQNQIVTEIDPDVPKKYSERFRNVFDELFPRERVSLSRSSSTESAISIEAKTSPIEIVMDIDVKVEDGPCEVSKQMHSNAEENISLENGFHGGAEVGHNVGNVKVISCEVVTKETSDSESQDRIVYNLVLNHADSEQLENTSIELNVVTSKTAKSKKKDKSKKRVVSVKGMSKKKQKGMKTKQRKVPSNVAVSKNICAPRSNYASIKPCKIVVEDCLKELKCFRSDKVQLPFSSNGRTAEKKTKKKNGIGAAQEKMSLVQLPFSSNGRTAKKKTKKKNGIGADQEKMSLVKDGGNKCPSSSKLKRKQQKETKKKKNKKDKLCISEKSKETSSKVPSLLSNYSELDKRMENGSDPEYNILDDLDQDGSEDDGNKKRVRVSKMEAKRLICDLMEGFGEHVIKKNRSVKNKKKFKQKMTGTSENAGNKAPVVEDIETNSRLSSAENTPAPLSETLQEIQTDNPSAVTRPRSFSDSSCLNAVSHGEDGTLEKGGPLVKSPVAVTHPYTKWRRSRNHTETGSSGVDIPPTLQISKLPDETYVAAPTESTVLHGDATERKKKRRNNDIYSFDSASQESCDDVEGTAGRKKKKHKKKKRRKSQDTENLKLPIDKDASSFVSVSRTSFDDDGGTAERKKKHKKKKRRKSQDTENLKLPIDKDASSFVSVSRTSFDDDGGTAERKKKHKKKKRRKSQTENLKMLKNNDPKSFDSVSRTSIDDVEGTAVRVKKKHKKRRKSQETECMKIQGSNDVSSFHNASQTSYDDIGDVKTVEIADAKVDNKSEIDIEKPSVESSSKSGSDCVTATYQIQEFPSIASLQEPPSRDSDTQPETKLVAQLCVSSVDPTVRSSNDHEQGMNSKKKRRRKKEKRKLPCENECDGVSETVAIDTCDDNSQTTSDDIKDVKTINIFSLKDGESCKADMEMAVENENLPKITKLFRQDLPEAKSWKSENSRKNSSEMLSCNPQHSKRPEGNLKGNLQGMKRKLKIPNSERMFTGNTQDTIENDVSSKKIKMKIYGKGSEFHAISTKVEAAPIEKEVQSYGCGTLPPSPSESLDKTKGFIQITKVKFHPLKFRQSVLDELGMEEKVKQETKENVRVKSDEKKHKGLQKKCYTKKYHNRYYLNDASMELFGMNLQRKKKV